MVGLGKLRVNQGKQVSLNSFPDPFVLTPEGQLDSAKLSEWGGFSPYATFNFDQVGPYLAYVSLFAFVFAC